MIECAKRRIILYGAGYCGAMVSELLKKRGIIPACIFDQNRTLWGTEVFGIPVVAPEPAEKNDKALIIVCLLEKDTLFCAIRSALKELGYQNVVHIFDLGEHRELFAGQNLILSPNTEKVKALRAHFDAMERSLADEASKDLLQTIRRCLEGDSTAAFKAESLERQYFAYDLYRQIPDEAVIDAGGFKGEVMDLFMKRNNGRFRVYNIVEPDWHYHDQIALHAKQWDHRKIHLFPYALSDRAETVRLRNYANANSVVKPDGEIQVQAYSVDELFRESECTFLKIDVEGYEEKVMAGARNLICRSHPVIAAATYHYEEEFFRLFEFLCGLTDGYSFYLRSYMNLAETVLYAVPDARRVCD